MFITLFQNKDKITESKDGLAENAMTYCKKTILLAPNNPNKDGRFDALISADKEQWKAKFEEIENCGEKVNAEIQKIFDKWVDHHGSLTENDFIFYKITSDVTQKYSIGNCSHQSSIIFDYILEHNLDPALKVDIMCLENGKHVFIVLGRDNNSDLDDYKTWKNALICDPWANKKYSASEIETELFDYEKTDPMTGKAIVKPFDPANQKVKLLVTNIFSQKEFDSMHREKNIKVSNYLKRFNETTQLSNKLKLAKQIIAELKLKNPLMMRPVEKMLYSQMQYFIQKFTR